MRIKKIISALLIAGLTGFGLPVNAQYPDRPLRVVVPFPPGATNDILGRAFAQELSREFGQPVIVENRGGAGTAIGAQAVATARPDGYTMLLGTGTTYVLNPALRPNNLSYDPVRDFAMVSIMAEVPIVFIVNPQLPVRNLAELVAYARAHPGKINFSSFKGKKILIVNTASKCGYTPQYEGLEALYKKYKDRLVIVGFPANNFGGQEPGSNSEIKDFCKKNYGVTFLMAAKVSVFEFSPTAFSCR